MIWPDRETFPLNVSSFMYVYALTQLHGQARRRTLLSVFEPLVLEHGGHQDPVIRSSIIGFLLHGS